MARWFRVYDDLIDDPKYIRLPDSLKVALHGLWCVASKNRGVLPQKSDIAISLRKTVKQVEVILAQLMAAGLLDRTESGLEPHNWRKRQHESDVSTERVKRFRKREAKRDETVSETVPYTETETEAESDTETEKKDSGAKAPAAGAARDYRADLFQIHLAKLAALTGKTPNSCRSLVGKWLSAVKDEAIHVVGLIEEAERERVADPVGWIQRRINTLASTRGPPGFVPRPLTPFEAEKADLRAAIEQLERRRRDDSDLDGEVIFDSPSLGREDICEPAGRPVEALSQLRLVDGPLRRRSG
jgi:hypothetical protein